VSSYRAITYRTGILLFLLLLSCVSSSPYLQAQKRDGEIIHRKWLSRDEGMDMESIIYSSDGLQVGGLLFSPPHKSRLPCIIFCHDGMKGISREHRLAGLRLAKAGYVVFSPSYRGEDGCQGEVEIAKGEVRDVLNALTMASHLEHVDEERLALVGTSHGATIALLAAPKSRKIRALVFAYGIADIYKWWRYLKKSDRLGSDRITLQTYGKGPDDRPLSFAIRNGVSHVSRICCPVLIMQGEKDEIVPEEQALCLEQALKEHGKSYRLRIYPNCAHGFLIYVPYIKDPSIDAREIRETEEAWRDLHEFLESSMKTK
jgi:dipeptidyl aminopeptidase/acylaminoacyl peptidase